MKEIGVICLLPEKVNNYYNDLRLKVATRFGLEVNHNVPAHITLKYHFPVESIEAIEKETKEFCMSQIRTKWVLDNFGHFINPDKYVVFIDAIPSQETRKAHASFLNRLRKINWVQWGSFDNADLHYHVTVASKGITSENFETIWAFVNQQKKPDFEVFFDNLALVQKEGDNRSIYKIYRFPRTLQRQ